MNICKNNCSHDSNKLIELLQTVKSLYERLTKDVCQYARELEKFQDYYQRFDLNNDVMLRIMNLKLSKLLTLFYISIANHLSVTTNVRGIGEKIIKPVKLEYGTTTTIKYQNICKSCTDCDKCDKVSDNVAKQFSTDRFVGSRDLLKVQTTVNIATYDNISIVKIIEDDVNMGYLITIGKLSYRINNYGSMQQLKGVVINQPDESSKEKITTKSIDLLYEFIDNQIGTLADVETVLVTNIEYVNKYIKKFKSN